MMGAPLEQRESDRLKFPAMLPREREIWRGWLREHEQGFDRFDYNVRLGEGQDPGPSFPDFIRRDSILITQKRIDAVGFQGSQVTIFEVKERAGLSAIGQLVGYAALWRAAHPLEPEPRLVLVTNVLDPDMVPGLRSAGIALALVPVEFPPGLAPPPR